MVARKRAGDLTGLEAERLIKENQAELKIRAQEIAMMAEVEAEQSDIPVDYSEGPITATVEELDIIEVKLESPTRVIIPNTTLDKMTFGAGKHYDFEEGKKYTVPADLARHLESKGLLFTGAYR